MNYFTVVFILLPKKLILHGAIVLSLILYFHQNNSMALLEEFLLVKDSTIPNSGQGLFTKTFISKGTLIVEYKGRRTTWKEVENDYKNGYIYFISKSKVIDAKGYKKA